jgi:branched-chain amino acid transport system permease protein
LSVTQAAFYGIGAYATAILITSYGVNFFLSILAGMAIAAVSSFIIGYVLSKFDGDYFALGSFGFNIIIFSIFLNWQGLTRGPLSIPGIDRPEIFGYTFSDNIPFLILVTLFAAAAYFFSQFIVNSSFGRVLKAIRDDEKAIQIFGYKTHYYKLIIFMIGAMMASVAGSLFASYITFIDPSTFNLNESIFVLSIISSVGWQIIKVQCGELPFLSSCLKSCVLWDSQRMSPLK